MSSAMYIKFEDPVIEGESTAVEHKNEIEVMAWSQPPHNTGDRGRSAHVTDKQFSFTKHLDRASNALREHAGDHKQIGKATLTCYHGTGAKPPKVLEVLMERLIIADVRMELGGPASSLPVEDVTLDFGSIRYIRYPHNPQD